MTVFEGSPMIRMTRRSALRASLLAPLAASGCSLFEGDWLGESKPPIPGTRVAVIRVNRGLNMDNPRNERVTLPAPVARDSWPQAGGTPAHEMGHAAVREVLTEAWSTSIGEGGGYRRKITSQPVVAGGRVFAMDANAVVTAFDVPTGRQIWQTETRDEDDSGTNVGGGVSFDGGTLYVATGRADALAIDPETGKIRWRQKLESAARAAPTIAEGRFFVPVLGDQLEALSVENGKRSWSYKATSAQTAVLGLPSPAYADGLVVAGFGSGDIVGLRAGTGAVVWADSLASARGRNAIADLSAVRGMPVIQDGRVYAVGLGGLMLALDLRSGRRLWERDIASSETPCVAGDWIYVISTDSQVAALNRVDGSVAWVTQLDKFENMEKQRDPIRWMGPTLAADRLVVAGSNATALAVSPYTGQILGQQPLSGPVSVPPIVALLTVFIVTDDGRLLALR